MCMFPSLRNLPYKMITSMCKHTTKILECCDSKKPKNGLCIGDWLSKLRFGSVHSLKSCPTLGDPMNHSTPGLPVHHQLPESTQTHVH